MLFRSNPPGTKLRVLYRADWTDEQLKHPPTDEFITVEQTSDGRAYVRLSLPPAGMIILGGD